MDYLSIPFRGGGVAILSAASCYRDLDKLWPYEPPWLMSDFTFTLCTVHVQSLSKPSHLSLVMSPL